MEFTIKTDEIQKIVNFLGVTAKVNTTDSSGRVLISVNGSEVKFLSVNLATSVELLAENVDVSETGEVAVLYSRLKSFITSFKPWDGESGVKEFNFKLTENGLVISLTNQYANKKKSKGSIRLETFNTYSVSRPKAFEQATFILNSSIINTATNKVLYAINPNEVRQHIQGMNIKFSKDTISFAGANGLILSEYRIKNISELTEGSFILSYSFVMGLRRLITGDDQLFFEITNNNIIVKIGKDICFWGRLIIGQDYPEYEDLLNNYSDTITINKEVLISVLKPFMDVLNSDDHNRLSMKLEDKKMVLYNDNASFEYEDEVNYEQEFTIDINGSSMLQTVDAIKDERLIVKFSNSNGMLIFDSDSYQDQKALITPIKQRA